MPFLSKLLNGYIAKLFKNNVTIEQSNNSTIRKGFTLIELLVVISIIGILATFVVASFTSAQAKGRDSRRKADLDALKKAFELARSDSTGSTYYPQCNPAAASCAPSATLPAIAPTYIKTVPTDPKNSSPNVYLYAPLLASCTTACTSHTITACLENANDTSSNTIVPVAPCTTRSYQVTNP